MFKDIIHIKCIQTTAELINSYFTKWCTIQFILILSCRCSGESSGCKMGNLSYRHVGQYSMITLQKLTSTMCSSTNYRSNFITGIRLIDVSTNCTISMSPEILLDYAKIWNILQAHKFTISATADCFHTFQIIVFLRSVINFIMQ